MICCRVKLERMAEWVHKVHKENKEKEVWMAMLEQLENQDPL
jgi:hypothetical protein